MPPRNHSLAPGTATRRDATSPPVSDSATASVSPLAEQQPADHGLHRLVGVGEHDRSEHGADRGRLRVEQLVRVLRRCRPSR